MDYVGSIAAINRIVRQLGHSLVVNNEKKMHLKVHGRIYILKKKTRLVRSFILFFLF